MDIVCNIDNNYTKYCAVMLTSLFENNKGEKITIHILGNGLSEETKAILIELVVNKYGSLICFYDVGEIKFTLPRTTSHISIATYYRLFIASLLPKSLSKVLYLDCDLLVVDSLRAYWNTDISQYAVGVVEEMWAFSNDRGERLNYPSTFSYFNAGVMLINIDYWRKMDFDKQAVDFIREKFELIIDADQDVLNAILYNQKLFVPYRYNLQDGFYRRKRHINPAFEDELNKEITKPVIIHFTNKRKPWKFNCIHPFRKEYFKYLDMTIWKGERPQMTLKQRWKLINYRISVFLHFANGFRKIS